VGERSRQTKRPTQADVARLASVSQPVVSYVLSGDPRAPVAEQTRQRVLEAIAHLGYVPDHAARSLRNRRTSTIAGVIPDITNPFYPAFERGIQDVAEQAGYDLITYNTDGTLERERKFLHSALAGRVDGLIITPFHVPMAEIAALAEAGIPSVALMSEAPPPGSARMDTLSIDGVTAAQTAVLYLIGRGHRRIGMVAGEAGTPPREKRVLGYIAALREHGLQFDRMLVRGSDFSEAGGYEAARELLQLAERPTAIFAANDLMAMGAMAALREASIAIPEEMAIVGFDDIPAARLIAPPLTTIAQYPERLGARAAELLLERLAGGRGLDNRHIVMPFDLVIRQSA